MPGTVREMQGAALGRVLFLSIDRPVICDWCAATYDFTFKTSKKFPLRVEAMNDNLTAGQFISFFAAMMLMLQPIRRLTNVNATLQRDGETLQGIGTLESVVIGRHARSGFKDFFVNFSIK